MAASQQFRQASGNNSGGSSTTYSSVSFGPAAADRYIVAIVTGRHTSSFTQTATIGGVSATEVATVINSSANRMSIFIAAVPTGLTGSVVISFSAIIIRNMISVFSLTGIDSPTPIFTSTSTANPGIGTITIPAGGIAIAGSYNILGGSYTWSNLTKRHDDIINTNNYWSAASDDFATLQTSRVITATMAGSPLQPVSCFAAWAPSAGGGIVDYQPNHLLLGC